MSRNGAVTDVVAAGDVGQCFLAAVAAVDRLALLVRRQLRLTSQLHTTGHSARSPFSGAIRIRSRSNSASPPSTVSMSRPCEVVVSAHGSVSDRNPALRSAIAASVFHQIPRRSREPVKTRHHRHVAQLQPSINRRSGAPSVLAPLTRNLRGRSSCIRPWSVAAPRYASRSRRPAIPARTYISGLSSHGAREHRSFWHPDIRGAAEFRHLTLP